MRDPKVSVVIVNHNGADALWNCLFALKTQTFRPDEIILVDNASTDGSVPFVRQNYPQVDILECQENFGYAMGCNLGAKCATGDVIALLNNDTVVTPEWLGRMVQTLKDGWPEVGAVASEVKPLQETQGSTQENNNVLNFLGRPARGFMEREEQVFYPEGCALAYVRLLAPEGPFDDDYFLYHEDIYLGWKLRLGGLQVIKALDAKVFHQGGGTMAGFPGWRAVYYDHRNRWLNLSLFLERGNLIKIFPWAAMELAALLVRGLFTSPELFLGVSAGFIWILTRAGAIARKRSVLQERRKIEDQEIMCYISGRVVRDGAWFSRFLNFVSLTYCRVVGLPVMEFSRD